MYYLERTSSDLREAIRAYEGVKWVNCDRVCLGVCFEAGEEPGGFLNRGFGPFCKRQPNGEMKCECKVPPDYDSSCIPS